MGADKVNNPGSLNLDYSKLKVKKTFMMKMMGIGGKIDKANKSIAEACGETKKGDTKAKDGVSEANAGVDQADDTEYDVSDGLSLQDDGENEASSTQTEADQGVEVANAGQTTISEASSVESIQTSTMEKIAGMTEGLSGTEAELMANLQEKMTQIADAGNLLMANGEEVTSLQAELAELTADDAGNGQGGPNYAPNMAAAGGENSAYSLNVPTGAPANNGPKKAPKKGGLISNGQPTAPAQAPQGNNPNNTPAQGANANGGSDKTARTQAIYQRLAEIVEDNATIQQTVESATVEAMEIQSTLTTSVETQSDEVTADQTAADTGNQQAQETLAEFQKIQMIGTAINVGGAVVKGVGNGISATGTTVTTEGATLDVKGKGISALGKFFKGLFTGVKVTGKAVAPTFAPATSVPGGTLVATGLTGTSTAQSTDGTGKGVSATGKLTVVTGKNVYAAGRTVHKVGQGIQVAGQGVQAVGAAGTVVAGIQSGNWTAILGGAIGFLGSAASFVGNAAQFAQTLGAAKDGFIGACANLNTTITEALGNAGSLSQVASMGQQAGNNAIMGGTGGSFIEGVTTTATTFVPGSNIVNPSNGGNTAETGATTTETKPATEEKPATGDDVALKARAKSIGLSDKALNNKKPDQIKQLIAKFNSGEIDKDGNTIKKDGNTIKKDSEPINPKTGMTDKEFFDM